MRYVLFFVCFSLLPMPALSDESSRNAGDKSLNFSFSDFAVDYYKYGIGGKYWVSDDIAITGSISVQKGEQDIESNSGGVSSQANTDAKSYGFSVGAENHFHSNTNLSPYVGGELYYSDREADTPAITNSTMTEWGANVLLGAEYAFTDAVALAAEYSFGYHDSESTSSNISGTTTSTSKGFGLDSGKLILLLYF